MFFFLMFNKLFRKYKRNFKVRTNLLSYNYMHVIWVIFSCKDIFWMIITEIVSLLINVFVGKSKPSSIFKTNNKNTITLEVTD